MGKKRIVIILVIAIIILTVGVLFYKSKTNVNDEINAASAVNPEYKDLQLRYVVTYLESCKNSMNLTDTEKRGLSDTIKYCAMRGSTIIPPATDIQKLKSIQDIQGFQVCHIPGAGENSPINCSFNRASLESCNKLFSISYTELISGPTNFWISIYECKDSNYLERESQWQVGTPRSISIFKIRPEDNYLIQSI